MSWRIGLLAVGITGALAGCGGSSSSSSSSPASSAPAASTASATTAASAPSASATAAPTGGGQVVKLAAVPGKLAFNTQKLTAKAGVVTMSMANPSSFPHGIAVEGHGVDKNGKVVNQNGTSTVTVTLKPGTYTFYCPVPGHRQAGMQGTLVVS
jgi:plastocyanin